MPTRKGSALGTLLGDAPPATSTARPSQATRTTAARPLTKPPESASDFLAHAFGLESFDDPHPPTFLASSKWTGPRPGWVFKQGDFGVGCTPCQN